MNIKAVLLDICTLVTVNALASELGYRGARAAYRSAIEAYPGYADMGPSDSGSVPSPFKVARPSSRPLLS